MRSLMAFGLVAVLAGAVAVRAETVELKVGDAAPNFTLGASDGKTYTLADFKGKKEVVLAWFPKAFTGGCTIECKSLAEHGDQIRKYDVAYFMISVDAIEGEKGNKAFAEAHKADFPLLGDPTKKTAEAYGVLRDMGQAGSFANRWTFYIGKDGKIQEIDKDVAKRLATSAEDMAAKLGELKVAMARK